MWGLIPLKGFLGLVLFAAFSAGLIYVWFTALQVRKPTFSHLFSPLYLHVSTTYVRIRIQHLKNAGILILRFRILLQHLDRYESSHSHSNSSGFSNSKSYRSGPGLKPCRYVSVKAQMIQVRNVTGNEFTIPRV